ncbi:MAG TPA: phage tail tip lysozyme [Trebonia sp.]
MSAGTRRNGISKVGLFKHSRRDGGQPGQRHGIGGSADEYTGRHAAGPRSKTARKRAGRAVPAAGVAAALAVGAAAYGLVATSGHLQATQLSADVALPLRLSSATHAGVSVGGVSSAAAAMIAAARTAGGAVASSSAKPTAGSSSKPKAAPSASPASTAASTAQSPSTEAGATDTPSATATPTSQATTQSSSGGSAAVQRDIANGNYVLAIGQYLVDNGYSAAAAAGVASCVDGESGANPESEGSGGGGLIGWTPLGSAEPDANIITGDVSVDMTTQLADILYYNSSEIGQSAVGELNSQTDPVAAADFYSQNFEKPAVTDSDVVPSVAEDVYSELGG